MAKTKRGWDPEGLVRSIGQSGWTEDRFEAFETLLGATIRRSLAAHGRKLKLSVRGPWLLQRAKWDHVLENTMSDMWIALADSLISRYLLAVDRGDLNCGFPAYLNGVIRLLLIDNAREEGLLPTVSVRELARRYCRATRDKTRRRIIGILKGQYSDIVKHEILARCSESRFRETYKNIYHITDHFFERFFPRAVGTIHSRGTFDLLEMIDQYVVSELQNGVGFRGEICAVPPHSVISIDGNGGSTDERLSYIAFQQGRLA